MNGIVLVIAGGLLVVSMFVMLRVLLALDAIRAAADVVARNLQKSHDRANAAQADPGMAADAAARKPDAR